MIIKFDIINKSLTINDNQRWSYLQIKDKKKYFKVLRSIVNLDNKTIQLYSDNYDLLDLHDYLEFLSNPISDPDFLEKYQMRIRKWIVKQINPIDMLQLNKCERKLSNEIEQKLFLLDLPISIDQEPTLLEVLKAFNLHFDTSAILTAYDIIYLVMRLHAILQPNKILCLNDVSNYLEMDELKVLKKECNLLKIKMILIN